ncbi:class II D-tagatose-bisphosphate aldolase, non-catalytic subunit [Gallibacter sp. Marseille-QA0791]|uniref:class II D-tagatose-bisphosphate aldolase, non-catalytic subunit n=1 Tax=Gallibacter sp. Marseille-QA0791 TaxID=3378781 RepID=UPI003D0EEE7B
MQNYLLNYMKKAKNELRYGVPSFCCANKIVLEAVLEQAKRFDSSILIEGTSNQVNQFGGYTGMTPRQFKEFVYDIADKVGFDSNRILIGGDHMGPLPWCDLKADEAMENAKALVRECVLAGFQKVHLDTSMLLADDSRERKLSNEIIAERGVELYKECEEAYNELCNQEEEPVKPVFVIGSEVPVPGGIRHDENEMNVTSVRDFEDTLSAYKKKFKEQNMEYAWSDIIAIVVQIGVEFGAEGIIKYDRVKSRSLCKALENHPNIAFEGHSTDFQSPVKLKQMVEDGVAIIKVGPALTMALREGLVSLDYIEKQLVDDASKRSNFIEILNRVMLENPKYWTKYYSDEESKQRMERIYSFSDRCRYYLTNPEVEKAIEKLFFNLDSIGIPLCLIHQYMPMQYKQIRDGKLKPNAKELVKSGIIRIVEDYNYATKCNYMINDTL